ncbi:GlsB/YeaQ/YmgE family stress response membrane protein [Patescibacteria group bacterium]|nr:GlsB/YeaQ/YmgE family stress response membrane protein [Patescibacteria group bacterium]
MNILLWLILGAVSGWIASMIMKTDQQQGIFLDVVLGIVGAVIGGTLMSFFGQPGATGFNFYSLFVSVLGAVALLSLGKFFSRSH